MQEFAVGPRAAVILVVVAKGDVPARRRLGQIVLGGMAEPTPLATRAHAAHIVSAHVAVAGGRVSVATSAAIIAISVSVDATALVSALVDHMAGAEAFASRVTVARHWDNRW